MAGGEGVDDRFDLRHLHELALARALAVAEGGEHGNGEMAGVDDVVGVVGADADGRAVGEAGELADARDGRKHRAEAEEVAVGPGQALHGRVGGDDAGVDGGDLFVEEVPLRQDAGREVRHENVGALDEAAGESPGRARG